MVPQIGPKRYIEIQSSDRIVLPPLLVKKTVYIRRVDKKVELASKVVEAEGWVERNPLGQLSAELDVERRKMDLALNIVDAYLGLLHYWHWGIAVIEWIRQCEITFDTKISLRGLLRTDVWPHAGRASFVDLLIDKNVPTDGVSLDKAVGLAISFRQPPPIAVCSDQLLFYLSGPIAESAYQRWASMSPDQWALPPDKFEFNIFEM